MENISAYLVEYSEKPSFFGEFGELKREYWSSKVLSKRLLQLQYYIKQATFVVVEADTPIIDE